MDEKGTIGMDEKLDLGILVKVYDRLSPKVISQSPVARFLSGEKGWTTVPLRVGGTISNPSYGVDTKAVGSKIREGVQKKLGEELQKFLPKGQPQQQPGTEQIRPAAAICQRGFSGNPSSNKRREMQKYEIVSELIRPKEFFQHLAVVEPSQPRIR